jgi:hypothetical protein
MAEKVLFDVEITNQHRSDAAEKALLSFAQDSGELDHDGALGELSEQNITDLLVDLAHYCDRQGLSLQRCLAKAERHYREEANKLGKQFSHKTS